MQTLEGIDIFQRDDTPQADCVYQAPNNCTGFVPTDCCDRVVLGSGVILSYSLVLIALCLTFVLALL